MARRSTVLTKQFSGPALPDTHSGNFGCVPAPIPQTIQAGF
jgi:hypothetical protein